MALDRGNGEAPPPPPNGGIEARVAWWLAIISRGGLSAVAVLLIFVFLGIVETPWWGQMRQSDEILSVARKIDLVHAASNRKLDHLHLEVEEIGERMVRLFQMFTEVCLGLQRHDPRSMPSCTYIIGPRRQSRLPEDVPDEPP